LDSGWEWDSDDAVKRERSFALQGFMETMEVEEAWRSTAEGYPPRLRSIFIRLETLATGSFLGSQETLWRTIGLGYTPWSKRINNVQRIMSQFLADTPSLRHFCQHGSSGPYTMGVTRITAASGNQPTITSHDFHNLFDDFTFLPIVIGVRTRWILHTAPIELECRNWARNNLADACQNRAKFALNREFAAKAPGWVIVGGLYCEMPDYPQNYPLPELPLELRKTGESREEIQERWRISGKAYAKELGEEIGVYSRKLPPWVKAMDDWKVAPLCDAPACEACGWRYEE
jgi:hypothetical protein